MTAAELIKTTEDQIKSQSGYSYNPSIVADICTAGWDGLEDGTVIEAMGAQAVSIDKDRNVLSVTDGEAEVNTIPLTDDLKNKAVAVIAIKRSRKGYSMGSI